MRMRKKKWVKPFLENESEYLINKYNDSNNNFTYLEIGMGMGDFIVESAIQNPDIFYLGLEKDETCVARAIKKAQENNVTNFRVMLLNASEILDAISEKTIDRIYLHFSDPWPKKAHHKRRLTYPTFLKLYEKLLKVNGEIVLKTDNYNLFNDSKEYFSNEPFKLIEANENYKSEEINEPMTGYQKKFSSLGQPIYYLKYKLK